MSTPDPKTVREIAQDCAADYLGDACDLAAHVIGHFGPGAPDDLYPWITAVRADLAAAVATWPDEQQPVDVVTTEQQQDAAAGAVQRFADAWHESNARDRAHLPSEDGRRYFGDSWFQISGTDTKLTEPDLRAVLAERTALAARVTELESEREADTRAVTAVLKLGEVLYLGQRPTDWADARRQLTARFADRIEALDARTESATVPTYRGVACWPPIAAPDGRSGPVERSEASGGSRQANTSASPAAELSEPGPCDGDCDCDCQPGQPCLCPERDCYCGPCRVCGDTPQQASNDMTEDGR